MSQNLRARQSLCSLESIVDGGFHDRPYPLVPMFRFCACFNHSCRQLTANRASPKKQAVARCQLLAAYCEAPDGVGTIIQMVCHFGVEHHETKSSMGF